MPFLLKTFWLTTNVLAATWQREFICVNELQRLLKKPHFWVLDAGAKKRNYVTWMLDTIRASKYRLIATIYYAFCFNISKLHDYWRGFD